MLMFHYSGAISAEMEEPCTCQSVADFLEPAYENEVRSIAWSNGAPNNWAPDLRAVLGLRRV